LRIAVAQDTARQRTPSPKKRSIADEFADLLFAVEPDTDGNTHRLYFKDEIPRQSDAG